MFDHPTSLSETLDHGTALYGRVYYALHGTLLCARSRAPAAGSRMSRATTAPEANVSAAMTLIAQAIPKISAMMPAERALRWLGRVLIKAPHPLSAISPNLLQNSIATLD